MKKSNFPHFVAVTWTVNTVHNRAFSCDIRRHVNLHPAALVHGVRVQLGVRVVSAITTNCYVQLLDNSRPSYHKSLLAHICIDGRSSCSCLLPILPF